MKKLKPSRAVTAFVKLTGAPGAFLFFKYKLYFENKAAQPKKLPKPCILMSNHTSLMDFVLYLTVFPARYIRFLMAEVLFRKNALFSWLLFKLGGIYVDRDTKNLSFLSESVKVLEEGGTVGVFPQGRLPVGGKPWPFKPGIVLIALKSGAPIVPVYTDGRYGITKRARVIIGESIDLRELAVTAEPDGEEIARLTAFLEEKNESLRRKLEAMKEEEKK